MSSAHATGLGDPQPVGKKVLFAPAIEPQYSPSQGIQEPMLPTMETLAAPCRVRTTLELTHQALAIIQEIQGSHRLKTGKVLPLWKLISQAIETYGKATVQPLTSHPEPALHDPDGKRKL